MVQYLKVENAILRGKLPKVVQVTPRKRAWLVKDGKALSDKIKALIQIVTPRTFARWVNGESGRKAPAKKGRPRTAEYIRELVLKLAKETGWGYTRILGELKKLGIRSVGWTTGAEHERLRERWVQTIKTECLDHFVVLGEAHLRYIVSDFVTYYHEHRPHQAKDNQPLVGDSPPETTEVIRYQDIICRKRLGGLLKRYSRKAA